MKGRRDEGDRLHGFSGEDETERASLDLSHHQHMLMFDVVFDDNLERYLSPCQGIPQTPDTPSVCLSLRDLKPVSL